MVKSSLTGLNEIEAGIKLKEQLTERELREHGHSAEFWTEVFSNVTNWLRTMDEAPSWSRAWRSSQLYEDYVKWSEEHKVSPINGVVWGTILKANGYPAVTRGGRKRRLWRKSDA